MGVGMWSDQDSRRSDPAGAGQIQETGRESGLLSGSGLYVDLTCTTSDPRSWIRLYPYPKRRDAHRDEVGASSLMGGLLLTAIRRPLPMLPVSCRRVGRKRALVGIGFARLVRQGEIYPPLAADLYMVCTY